MAHPARLVSALVLLLLVLWPASAEGQGPLFATVSGPEALSPGQTATYNLSIFGGPHGAVSYSVRFYLTGPDPVGAFPSAASPVTQTGNTTTFALNVTASSREQTLTLFVAVSASVGSTVEDTTTEWQIVVVTPIVLSAVFRNEGSTAAVNVTVWFYVDDARVGSQTIARIAPNGQGTASLSYLPVSLSPGAHRVRAEADLDGNGVIDPGRGEAVLSDLFYKSTPGLSTGWTILIGIGVFVPVFLATAALRRRGRT